MSFVSGCFQMVLHCLASPATQKERLINVFLDCLRMVAVKDLPMEIQDEFASVIRDVTCTPMPTFEMSVQATISKMSSEEISATIARLLHMHYVVARNDTCTYAQRHGSRYCLLNRVNT